MYLTKERLKKIIKEELQEVVSTLRGLTTATGKLMARNPKKTAAAADTTRSGAGAVDAADWALTGIGMISPYFAVVAAAVGSLKSAHEYWNSIPENHPLKVKHRDYIKRAAAAQKQERMRVNKAGQLPKNHPLRKASEKDAKKLLALMKKGGSIKQHILQQDPRVKELGATVGMTDAEKKNVLAAIGL